MTPRRMPQAIADAGIGHALLLARRLGAGLGSHEVPLAVLLGSISDDDMLGFDVVTLPPLPNRESRQVRLALYFAKQGNIHVLCRSIPGYVGVLKASMLDDQYDLTVNVRDWCLARGLTYDTEN